MSASTLPGKREEASRAGTATGGPVAEGNIGAGTGMSTFDFSGGIGTAWYDIGWWLRNSDAF